MHVHAPRPWLGALLALLCATTAARAEIPAFTPNVVDPGHRLSDGELREVNEAIASIRSGADVAAAVYIADRLGDDTIEDLTNRAFAQWKLGERGKDNGLLLVLAMEDRKMRFETGYGLEADLPDAVCRHALDDQLRPRLREGRIKDGVIDALYFLARKRAPSFTLDGRPPPTAASRSSQDFDARAGAGVWGLWFVLLGFLFYRKQPPAFDGRLGIFAFLIVNPGAFIFVGGALLSGHRVAIARAVGGFFMNDVVPLLPFYALVAAAAALPMRTYLRLAEEKERALYDVDRNLRALADRVARLRGEGRADPARRPKWPSIFVAVFAVLAVFFLGFVLGLDYREPVYFLVPAAVFWIGWRLGNRGLRRYTADAWREQLEAKERAHQARMELLVRRGHATRNDDGSYAYTSAYYESQSSSSSSSDSSSSSFSSSSDGGSSGGGGASSDW